MSDKIVGKPIPGDINAGFNGARPTDTRGSNGTVGANPPQTIPTGNTPSPAAPPPRNK